MPHFVATLVRHLRSRLVCIYAFPQVAFAAAHSTSRLSMVQPSPGLIAVLINLMVASPSHPFCHDFQWPIWVKIWCKHYNLHFVSSVHPFIQFTPFRLLFQPLRYSVLNVMSSVRGCTNSNSSVRASPSPSV